MTYNKRIFALVLVIALFFLSVNFASAVVVYQDGTARIHGATHSLKDITDTDYLEIEDGICYLKKPVVVTSTGTLKVTTSSCTVVNMYDTSMITVYGSIYFDGVKVTSYDPDTGNPIELSRTNYSTVRPDIVTRSSAQYFSAKNSEFSYLGYYNPTSSHWGVALRFLPKAYIDNSKFHHNYFGFYTFDSDNVTIKNSKVYDNLEYGIDIHDFSDNFYAYNNEVYGNGNHGIILSKFNENGKIILNKVHDHTQNAFVKGVIKSYGTHGIELHQQSNNALVSRNELTNNRVGIKVVDSHNNSIKSNKVFTDLEQGFYVDESHDNEFRYNQVLESTKEPYYAFNSFSNFYELNNWGDADDILYVKIEYEDGTIQRHKFPAPGADAKLNELSVPPGETASVETTSAETTSTESGSKSIVVESAPTENNNEMVEIDTVRDKKLGIKNKMKVTREEEKARVEKISKYERDLAKKMISDSEEDAEIEETDEIDSKKSKSKSKADQADLNDLKVTESNNENVEIDAKRDKKLAIKDTKKLSKEEEKALVEKIAKYEKDLADEIIES